MTPDDILEACTLLKIKAVPLLPADVGRLSRLIELGFLDHSRKESPIWARILDSYSVRDPKGWTKLSVILPNEKLVLFWEEGCDRHFLGIDSPIDLVRILGELHGFVFYVTNEACQYLVAFNDHDYLIGAGTAKKWISNGKWRE